MAVEDTTNQLIAILPRLRRFAVGLTGSPDEADDLVQAACERALSRLHQWNPGTRLDSWMYRIMQTIWIDQTRRRKVRGEQKPLGEIAELAGPDGRDEVEARLTLDAVRQAIGQLPEEQRVPLLLVCVEGLSYREASETLDIRIGTLMSRLHRARQRLGDLIHDRTEDLT